MATRKSKNANEEKLDSANMERVIALLEPTEPNVKPITKKDACQALNITYNTTRLGKLIEVYKEKKAFEQAKRASLRGKAATEGEIQYTVTAYLEGRAIDNIGSALYRSSGFVKDILIKHDVPIRNSALNYFKPALIPDGAVKRRFKVGDTVYSARYDSVAKIYAEFPHKYEEWVYRIWLAAERWKEFAYQPASELASLEHLEKLGVKF